MPSQRPVHLVEKMDDPAVSPADLADSLRFIRWVNRNLGGSAAVLNHLQAWANGWPSGEQTICMLDVATGSADVPMAVLAWAAGTGRTLQIIGLDNHAQTLAIAQAWGSAAAGVKLVRGDAFRLPLADGAVDYAFTGMFLHHLTEAQALAVLREMLRVSRRGIIVSDLLRGPLYQAAVGLMTLFARPMVRHDARLSVKKGWRRREVSAWPGKLNAPWLRVHIHWAGRFTLAGERSGACGPQDRRRG